MAVRLDPFRKIVGVGWGSDEVLILRVTAYRRRNYAVAHLADEDEIIIPDGQNSHTVPVMLGRDFYGRAIQPLSVGGLGSVLPLAGSFTAGIDGSQTLITELGGNLRARAFYDLEWEGGDFPENFSDYVERLEVQLTEEETRVIQRGYGLEWAGGVQVGVEGEGVLRFNWDIYVHATWILPLALLGAPDFPGDPITIRISSVAADDETDWGVSANMGLWRDGELVEVLYDRVLDEAFYVGLAEIDFVCAREDIPERLSIKGAD